MPTPLQLPILEVREDILGALRQCPRLILRAPTGSGKSTQLPQYLLDGGLTNGGEIIVLQPRRVAARMLAARVAHERTSKLGEEVGYQIRFDNISSPRTRIRFVTEGILLRRILEQPSLPGVDAVIFDEFHERNLYTDLTLALTRQAQQQHRPDLLLVVMSATLDSSKLSDYLTPCEQVHSEGRTFPVKIEYAAQPGRTNRQQVWDKAAAAAGRVARTTNDGNMLIFMPGAREIHRTVKALEKEGLGRSFELSTLYGDQSAQAQDRAMEESARRKIIVCTNIAETSLTIPGVNVVIDSGLARINRYDPHRGLNSLLVETICKSSAEQRAGRAGRLSEGRCIRLWGMQEHLYRAERLAPEIHRVDLSDTILLLKASGIENLNTLPWLEQPREDLIAQANALLQSLNALQPDGSITELGKRMSAFPMHPRYARLLIEAAQHDCVSEMCTIVAIAEERRLLLPIHDSRKDEERESMLAAPEGSDFFPALAALKLAEDKRFDITFCERWAIHAGSARRIAQTAAQYIKIAERSGLPVTTAKASPEQVRRCLMCGFIDHIAHRVSAGTLHCNMLAGQSGELRRESTVRKAELFVAAEVEEREAAGSVKLMLGMATAIEQSWLEEAFPNQLRRESEALYEPQNKRVIARQRLCFRDLSLESKDTDEVPEEYAARILAEKLIDKTLSLKHWDGETDQLICRINFAARECPETGIQKLDTEGINLILQQLCLGARGYKDIKEAKPTPAIRSWLSQEQWNALEILAPAEWTLPRRKRPIRLRYEEDKVVLAATIQELYDVPGNALSIASGKVPLTLELLAPNRRPIQITQNLDGFWEGAYSQIKKDLKGRYPKHEWR